MLSVKLKDVPLCKHSRSKLYTLARDIAIGAKSHNSAPHESRRARAFLEYIAEATTLAQICILRRL